MRLQAQGAIQLHPPRDHGIWNMEYADATDSSLQAQRESHPSILDAI